MRRRIVIRHKGGRPRMCVFATVGEKVDSIEENVQALLKVQHLEAMRKITTADENGSGKPGSSCSAAVDRATP